MSKNNTVTVDSASVLLSKYMSNNSISNSNLFMDEFPKDNLYEGRIIFLKVHEPNNVSENEQ